MFQPSKSLLEEIGFDDHSYYQHLVIPSYLNASKNEFDTHSIVAGTTEQIKEFYNRTLQFEWKSPLQCTFGSISGAQTWYILLEGLRNCYMHGSNGKEPYIMGLWMGREGLGFGFQDGGSYFRDPEIKRIYEGKQSLSHPPHREGRGAKGRGNGVSIIYENSDRIEVDTEKGVLYVTQNSSRFLIKKE